MAVEAETETNLQRVFRILSHYSGEKIGIRYSDSVLITQIIFLKFQMSIAGTFFLSRIFGQIEKESKRCAEKTSIYLHRINRTSLERKRRAYCFRNLQLDIVRK